MTQPTLDRYLEASVRQNTRRSYQQAIKHFEEGWGGFLPASAENVSRYLADYAGKQSINTLRLRLAALSHWHSDQGFPDPTKTKMVKKVFRGIRELHPDQPNSAKPLQIRELEVLVEWIDQELTGLSSDSLRLLRLLRDKAILLVGFWGAFRSDELSRLLVEDVSIEPEMGMTMALAKTKSDRNCDGSSHKLPQLLRLCPVSAYKTWIEHAEILEGSVFRAIDRWGHMSTNAISVSSINPLLHKLFKTAGLASPDKYSSHSLRRGFSSWAAQEGWSVPELMEYVGWRDMRSALKYIEGDDPYGKSKIDASLSKKQLVFAQDF